MTDLSAFYPGLQPQDERTGLEQRLEFCRRAVISRIEDLDDHQASSQPLRATSSSVGGIVKHLAWVEDRWFLGKLLGSALPEPWASAPMTDDPDWPFNSSRENSVTELVALYTAACARSRDATAQFDQLGAPAAAISFGKTPVNLRWLLIHMVDETAWHLGHLDLLRDALGVSNAH